MLLRKGKGGLENLTEAMQYKGDSMKLFMVELDNVDWDTYDGCIIVAASEKEVFEYITKENEECFFVEKDQHIKITEIKIEDYKEVKILLSSFNAG